MNRDEIDTFEKLLAQLQGMYDELAILAKKSPDSAINAFKLQFANQLLTQANLLLGSHYQPFPDFEQFDDDELPQYGDVVFILSQYLRCFEKLRADNIHQEYEGSDWTWRIDGKVSNLKTVSPKRLRG